MFKSRVNTVRVPIITAPIPTGGVAPSPATIIEEAGFDCVVKVRNNSVGVFVFIAFDPAVLQTSNPRADTFKLPAGAPETFVLARGQGLYASATSGPPLGGDVEISFHVYDELPVSVEA
jgi:hypothetical protein